MPTKRLDHAASQIKRLHQTWKAVQKNKSRKNSLAQKSKEETFKCNLDTLFDVAHHKAMRILRTEWNRAFLREQRNRRWVPDSPMQSQSSMADDSPSLSTARCSDEIESELSSQLSGISVVCSEAVDTSSPRHVRERRDAETGLFHSQRSIVEFADSSLLVSPTTMSRESYDVPSTSRVNETQDPHPEFNAIDADLSLQVSETTTMSRDDTNPLNFSRANEIRDSISQSNVTCSHCSISGSESTAVSRIDSDALSFSRMTEISDSASNATHTEDSSQQSATDASSQDVDELISQGLKRAISRIDHEIDGYPEPKKINVMTSPVVAALDRTNTSSRNATYVIAAVASSLGHDVDSINLSYSAIHRSRAKHRARFATGLKESLETAECLTVHWDGKILPEIVGEGMVERLPVIISGLNTEQLLGVPKLKSGTGANQAGAIIETVNEWNLTNNIRSLCFDTTSSNTGRFNGACAILEKTLERPLIYLACRHHVFELVLRAVFEVYWPATTGPNVAMFKRFQQAWSKFDVSQYETGFDDEIVTRVLDGRKDDIVVFIMSQLQKSQPRSDYRELLELACIFLGGTPPCGIRFKFPGAMHHARWLSKAIYSLKIFLFRRQFALSTRDSNSLREICIFVVAFYVETWYNSTEAIAAPYGDLTLLKNLSQYRLINEKVSKAARCKLLAHLWYLSEELVALALFDPAVSREEKIEIVQAMKVRESVSNFTKRAVVTDADLLSWTDKSIADFATKKSLLLFQCFELSYDFIDVDPGQWPNHEGFRKSRTFFKTMKVVNDVAERGVALIQAYNESLTRNEEQKQFLLQVVQRHRKQYPNCHKKTLRTS